MLYGHAYAVLRRHWHLVREKMVHLHAWTKQAARAAAAAAAHGRVDNKELVLALVLLLVLPPLEKSLLEHVVLVVLVLVLLRLGLVVVLPRRVRDAVAVVAIVLLAVAVVVGLVVAVVVAVVVLSVAAVLAVPVLAVVAVVGAVAGTTLLAMRIGWNDIGTDKRNASWQQHNTLSLLCHGPCFGDWHVRDPEHLRDFGN